MGRPSLNRNFLCGFGSSRGEEHASVSALSRRRFLQFAGATVGAFPLLARARASLEWAGLGAWDLDASWLAGRPEVFVERKEDVTTVSLSGARYPGTSIAADFSASIDERSVPPQITIRHALALEAVRMSLADWLLGTPSPVAPVTSDSIATTVGDFLRLRQKSTAALSMDRDLRIRAIGSSNDTFTLEGREVSGEVKTLEIARPIGTPLIDDETARRTRWMLRADHQKLFALRPAMSRGSRQLSLEWMPVAEIVVETADTSGDVRHAAFAASSEGGLTVSSAVDGPSGRLSKIEARDPTYARLWSSDEVTETEWRATQGRGTVPFGQHALHTAPASAGAKISITSKGGDCIVDCPALPASLSLASDDDVAVTLRFPGQSTSKPTAICHFSFSPKRLDLDDAEITFAQPANALYLRMRLQGFELVRHWGSTRLEVRDRQRCRVTVYPGSSAIVEQSFFEPPPVLPKQGDALAKRQRYETWLKQLYSKGTATSVEQGVMVQAALRLYDIEQAPYNNVEWQAKGAFPSRARISGPSQIVLRLKGNVPETAVEHLSLDVRALTNPDLWELVIARDAASSESKRKELSGLVPQQGKRQPPPDATWIEAPSSLYLSPDETARFAVLGLEVHAERTGERHRPRRSHDLFRLVAEVAGQGLVPLRAIATADFSESGSLPEHYVPPALGTNEPPNVFRKPLDLRDRSEFVWLTSQWDRAALVGTRDVRERQQGEQPLGYATGFEGVYVPKAVRAQLLMLTSMGAYLRATGDWDPPAFKPFAMSVLRWDHSSTLGRSHRDVVVYKGFLLPFGTRCSLIKETIRQERKLSDLGVVSIPIQKFFLEIEEPRVAYTGSLVPFGGRTWPFRSIELLLKGRLQIDDPARTGIAGLGQSAFRVCVGQAGHPFDFQVDDDAKRQGSAKLAFIDNTVAHSVPALKSVVDRLNATDPDVAWTGSEPPGPVPPGAEFLYSIDLRGSKVRYAPPSDGDDTSYTTNKMFVRMAFNEALVNSAILEATGKPAVYAQMHRANIRIPALNRITGRSDSTETSVETALLYRDVGFGSDGPVANEAEVFLTFTAPVQVSFSGNGDRSGAVASPNIEAHNLSRRIGVMGKVDTRLLPSSAKSKAAGLKSKVAFDSSSLFRTDAKLLGVLPMSTVFEALGLEDVPKFVERARHQLDAVEADLWEKACKFARLAANAADEITAKLQSELQYEGVQRIVADLADFRSAIVPIQSCTASGKLETLADAIAAAGQALDRLRQHAEAILQDPASLLPTSVREVIAFWSNLSSGWGDIRSAASALLLTEARKLQDQLVRSTEVWRKSTSQVIAQELEAAYASLNAEIERLRASTAPIGEFLGELVRVYSVYAQVYAGAVGWYRALAVANVRNQLIQWAQAYLLGSQADRFVNQLAIAVEQDLTEVENRIRRWDQLIESERESARAFFRREEPTLERATTAASILLARDKPSPAEQMQAAHDLQAAVKDLAFAAQREIDQQATRGPTPAYLTRIAAALKTTQATIANEGRKLGTPLRPLMSALRQQIVLDPKFAAVVKTLDDLESAWAKTSDEAVSEAVDRLCQLTAAASSGYAAMAAAVQLADSTARDTVAVVHTAARDCVSKLDQLMTQLKQLAKNLSYLFDKEFSNSVGELSAKVTQALSSLNVSPVPLPDSSAWQALSKDLVAAKKEWDALVQRIRGVAAAPDKAVIELVRSRVNELLDQLVPSEIDLDFDMNTEITKAVGGVFIPGLEVDGSKAATLILKAEIHHNLRSGASKAKFEGRLEKFRLKLLDLLVISFRQIRFEAESGSAPRLWPPDIADVSFAGGCLSFIDGLKNFFRGGSGPYVLPVPAGLRAGYMLRPGTIPVGGMIIQDLVLDTAVEIPFDDRAALTSFAVSKRDSPALLFIPPYGGTMFFYIAMAGDRLVGVHASFAAGLVSAFDLGAVEGSGMVTLGLEYRQVAEGMTLEGFFYAGGHGTILGLVSMGVSLRIGMRHGGSGVTGYGEFSVEMGHKPFEWTLSYSVSKDVSSHSPHVLGSDASVQRASRSRQPVDNLDTPSMSSLFLERHSWHRFRDSFAEEMELQSR